MRYKTGLSLQLNTLKRTLPGLGAIAVVRRMLPPRTADEQAIARLGAVDAAIDRSGGDLRVVSDTAVVVVGDRRARLPRPLLSPSCCILRLARQVEVGSPLLSHYL